MYRPRLETISEDRALKNHIYDLHCDNDPELTISEVSSASSETHSIMSISDSEDSTTDYYSIELETFEEEMLSVDIKHTNDIFRQIAFEKSETILSVDDQLSIFTVDSDDYVRYKLGKMFFL